MAEDLIFEKVPLKEISALQPLATAKRGRRKPARKKKQAATVRRLAKKDGRKGGKR
jgi:hypothetical protein